MVCFTRSMASWAIPEWDNKDHVGLDIRISGKLVFYIFHQHFFQCTAIFLSDRHTTISVLT